MERILIFQIKDISPLYQSSIFKDVTMFTLTNNKINYIDPVQFPLWLREKGDVGIMLDHNMLTKVVFLLDYLEGSPNG